MVRTNSLPSLIKQESESDRTRTVSLDGIDISEEDVFSQWNAQLKQSISDDAITKQASSTSADSKSIWKQIFSKAVKPKAEDDALQQQWSELDKDQPPSHHRFHRPSPAVKRTCPFYKKIPGRDHERLSSRYERRTPWIFLNSDGPASFSNTAVFSRYVVLCGCIQFRRYRRCSSLFPLAFSLGSLRWLE